MKIRPLPQTGGKLGEIEFRVIAYQLCKTCNVADNMAGFDPKFPRATVPCSDCDGEGAVREEVDFETAVANTSLFQKMLEAIANCAKTDEGIIELLAKAGFLNPKIKT